MTPRVYDPMATFDAEEAYNGDYRFAPGVKRGLRTREGVTGSQVFWLRRITLGHPDYPAAAETLGLISSDEAWEAWKEDSTVDDLRPNDVITLDVRVDEAAIIVNRTGLSHHSRWMFSATRAV